MKIYLAADYSRKEEMRGVRDILVPFGHSITSRWIDRPPVVQAFGIGGVRIDISVCGEIAEINAFDVEVADMLLLFTSGELSRGGRHTELGMAVAWCKSICIVGPREHSFHCFSSIRQYDNWPTFLLNEISGGLLK